MQLKRQWLAEAWEWKERAQSLPLHEDFASEEGWAAATVPGCIHQDLLAAQRISDPYWGMNEREAQWVGERDWLYRCAFVVDDGMRDAPCLDLCFEGLDTFAHVWLNGQAILQSDNMFLEHRVSIGGLIRPGRNDLWVCFESAWLHGKRREMQHVPLLDTPWVGDNSRFFVRKAQYHYGWDWGPKLLTAGVWRPVTLEAYDTRIDETQCTVTLSASLDTATLDLSASIATARPPQRFSREAVTAGETAYTVEITLYDPAGLVVWRHTCPVAGRTARATTQLEAPALWWPRQLGKQPLYRVTYTLVRCAPEGEEASRLDMQEHRFGIRRLVLKQEPSSDGGESFAFEVNNIPLFCGGANWIPLDMLLSRVAPAAYREWAQLAADSNMTMLRVWGGGVYEHDALYDACDELGVLIWQDFMFACGMYPGDAWFLESVRAEAERQVRRLRRHPSLALWCGNNEDYQVAARMGVYDPAFTGPHLQSRFPAREIYERILPEICARLDPTRAYWPGSPYGGADANSLRVGDQHLWSVWHDPMRDFHDYPHLGGRFVSEFGMASLPAPATSASFTDERERQPHSRVIEFHHRSVDGARRLAVYLSDTLAAPEDLSRYSYATQVVQAEALSTALIGWRRRWNLPNGNGVGGALVWQLNDCWPGTSWSLIDYYARPKPAYYAVKRALAPLALGATRATDGSPSVWAINATPHALPAHVYAQVWELDGALRSEWNMAVTLPALATCDIPCLFPSTPPMTSMTVLFLTLVVEGRAPVSYAVWPEPYKYVPFPDPVITLHRTGDDLAITVQRPVKGLWLCADDAVAWDDNYLDLMPGTTRMLRAAGLSASTAPLEMLWVH